ncbi:MAG: Crp/Fnr family transcriptional regulator, partial [Cyanobacteria bacterium M_surface_7_m2_037]|nr:Crp/Fnr family transcriptional regulator [Cyanobacteria bacterium M_surface_7_m2_037]
GQRIGALLQLLVERLGRRNGAWYELPLRLTHAELADLSGHTRVTVTKQLSRLRNLGLIEQDAGPGKTLRISPELLEA